MGVSIERILEKEIMSDKEQAACYAKADFSVSNQFFVDSLIKYSNLFIYVLDLGCGPADVCIRLAKAKRDIGILAVDASQPMLELAKDAMVNAKIKYKIKFKKEYLSDLKLIDDYDLIISKDLLHHLPDPMILWNKIKEFSRPGTIVYVMDLIRAESKEKAKQIVETVSGNESETLKQDFYNSLLAAFTLDEIKQQLTQANLDKKLTVEQVSERHFIVKGKL